MGSEPLNPDKKDLLPSGSSPVEKGYQDLIAAQLSTAIGLDDPSFQLSLGQYAEI